MIIKKTKVAAAAAATTSPGANKPIAPAKKSDAAALAALEQINVKQTKTRRNKAKESNLKMRQHLWPTHDKDTLWLREDTTRKGYTTMPRTMPLFINLINDISKQVTDGRSVPAGKSYLVLWCRVFDEGFLKIDSEASAALEAGYAGERNVTTWREHMAVLKQLGFIDCKEGPAGPFQYILLLNPYQVVKALKAKGWVQESAYTALFQRAVDIGASDLTED
jgi:hypothetical protein